MSHWYIVCVCKDEEGRVKGYGRSSSPRSQSLPSPHIDECLTTEAIWQNIHQWNNYWTTDENGQNKAQVEEIDSDENGHYIKTKSDSTLSNNLSKLPPCQPHCCDDSIIIEMKCTRLEKATE